MADLMKEVSSYISVVKASLKSGAPSASLGRVAEAKPTATTTGRRLSSLLEFAFAEITVMMTSITDGRSSEFRSANERVRQMASEVGLRDHGSMTGQEIDRFYKEQVPAGDEMDAFLIGTVLPVMLAARAKMDAATSASEKQEFASQLQAGENGMKNLLSRLGLGTLRESVPRFREGTYQDAWAKVSAFLPLVQNELRQRDIR